MQIVSIGDNLQEMSNLVYLAKLKKKKKKKKKKKNQYVACWKFYPECYALKIVCFCSVELYIILEKLITSSAAKENIPLWHIRA